MSDDKVLVSRELLEQALRGEIPKPRLDENYSCVGCGQWMPRHHPEAREHEEGCAEEASAGASHWSTRFMDLLAQPSDGALTNEGAEPVAWTYMHKDQQPYSDPLPCLVWASESIDIMREGKKTGDYVHYHPRPDLYEWRPLFYHQPKICTCPSGEGSLRWPCPVHPPEVKVALPERMLSNDPRNESLAQPCHVWNACLDRVKELNS